MPEVSDNRLKGNYGAAVVMARLSAECLVRPVAADTDVGVDLYCETVADGQPFLHFWVQVKTGEQCRTDPANEIASCRFEIDHLRYWLRQPVPVFAALVPTDWPPSTDPDVYIVDFTKKFIIDGLSVSDADQDSLTLRSDYRWPAGAREVVSKFLTQIVPDSTARFQCSEGIVVASPTPAPQYEHNMPPMPVTRFKKQILRQLRVTAAFSVLFALDSGEHTPEDSEFRHQLTRIIKQFVDDERAHWEVFMALACSSHADQDYSSALTFYRKAKDVIKSDLRLRDRSCWEARIRSIEQLEQRAQDRQPLHKAV